MAALLDPLRNTLDRLALDPKAREDRKYLVSMLRRLGYSDREIEEALGWESDAARVIEVEYEPPGERPVGGFTVVEGWEEPKDSAVGFSVARENGQARQWVRPADPALAFGWKPDTVEFVERSDDWASEAPSGAAAAWPDDHEADWQEADADVQADWPAPDEQADWQPAEADQETGWQETDADETPDWPDVQPALQDAHAAHDDGADAWPQADAQAGEWQVVEEDDASTQPTWAEPATSEPPQESLAEEPAEAWTDESDAAWSDTGWDAAPADTEWAQSEAPAEAVDTAPVPEQWEGESWDTEWDANQEPAAPQWQEDYAIKEPPAGSWQPAEEPFHYEEYTLYTRMVELSTGREQRIYFFAKNEPKSGAPCPLPSGYIVETNERTGLPFLRRDPDAESSEEASAEPEAWTSPEPPEAEADCLAVTKSGSQCRNAPRQGSKYCSVHRGWRGPRAE